MKYTNTTCIGLLLVFMLPMAALADAKMDGLIAQCSMCHGTDGNSPADTAPSIAGITEYYFKYTMDAYKNNGRDSAVMKMFVDNLVADDINLLAKYFAAQKPKSSVQEFNAELAQQGRLLHNKYCERCHSNNGSTSSDGYGILAGQWLPYLRLTLTEYTQGKRRVNDMMLIKLKKVRAEAGEKALEQLIHFYASLK